MSDQGLEKAPCFVCRCEELTVEELQVAIESGARTIDDVKRRTRAGMGVCQGAFCLQHVATLLNQRMGTPLELVAPMTVRPPVRWITLSALAGDQSN